MKGNIAMIGTGSDCALCAGSKTGGTSRRTATGQLVKSARPKDRVRNIPDRTYLGCPLTRNRTPWCFRICAPDRQGNGECGRLAPHGLKSRIQLAIEDYERKRRAS